MFVAQTVPSYAWVKLKFDRASIRGILVMNQAIDLLGSRKLYECALCSKQNFGSYIWVSKWPFRWEFANCILQDVNDTLTLHSPPRDLLTLLIGYQTGSRFIRRVMVPSFLTKKKVTFRVLQKINNVSLYTIQMSNSFRCTIMELSQFQQKKSVNQSLMGCD